MYIHIYICIYNISLSLYIYIYYVFSSSVYLLHVFCWSFMNRNIIFKKCLSVFLHCNISVYYYIKCLFQQKVKGSDGAGHVRRRLGLAGFYY